MNQTFPFLRFAKKRFNILRLCVCKSERKKNDVDLWSKLVAARTTDHQVART